MLLPAVLLFILLRQSQSVRILCALTSPSPSHAALFQPIYTELSLRGHQVTVFTPRPMHDKTLTNLTEIEIRQFFDILKFNTGRSVHTSDISSVLDIIHMGQYLKNFTKETLTKVKEMFPIGHTEFDLLIVEDLSPLIFSLGCRFKVPIIDVVPNVLPSMGHDLLGNPDHPLLYPDIPSSTSGKMGFSEKIINVFISVAVKIYYNWIYLPQLDTTTKEFFGEDCPRIETMMKNVSLMFTYTQPLLHPIRAHIPIFIEIGGLLQMQAEKPLPEDLQTYLDHSHQGVIYFSLGSINNSSELPKTLRDVITEALSGLPYNVLWKFETDSLPNQPKNVVTRDWVPQLDVLRHKNIKAFVTHAGILSIEEAILYAVPVVAIPLVLDQPSNARRVRELGIGQSVDYSTMTKDVLKDTIIDVAENVKYKNAIHEVRYLFQDKQMKSLDKAVWWIEYVIRHQGADHLKSRSTFSPWYEYYLVDVVSAFLLLALAISFLTYFFIKCTIFLISLLNKTIDKININNIIANNIKY